MKKRVFIVIGSIMFTLVFIVGGYLGMMYFKKQKANQELISEIQSHYSGWILIEQGNLYCKDENTFEKCGNIESPIEIPLESIKVKSIKNQYFQIKNTPYYLFYTEATPVKDREVTVSNYIPFNQNIKTKESTNFYQNDRKVLSIQQEIELPIYAQDQNYYYVTYLDQQLAILKTEPLELIEHHNTEEPIAEKIPVLYYENIETWKETDNWKEQLSQLKDQGFYSISLSDYEAWLRGYAQVKENAILLLSQTDAQVDGFQFYNKGDTSITWVLANTVSKPNKAYFYQIELTTTKEQFINMLAGNPVINTNNGQKVAVLNYHFFYNPDIGEACNENICLATSKFEEQLQYLKSNGYYTLTMEEFRDWMYGKMDIPEKSVLLTIDDGAAGTGKHNGNKLIPLLEKYDLHATLFLITGWWNIENYRSPNLDIESHTNDMHTMYQNGAQLLISTNEQVIQDLNQSIAVTKSKKAFCFPFYAYNETAIHQVKQVGFELSFIGGNYKASRNNDKYKIPRYPIYKNITMQQFIHMIS